MTRNNLSELDKRIVRVQRGTRSLINCALPAHNKLRSRYSWYHSWHSLGIASVVHWLILFCYLLSILVIFSSALLSSPKKVSAADIVWTGNGLTNDWSNPDNWEGGSVPGSGSIAVFSGISIKDATFDLAAPNPVGGIRIENDYSGVITLDQSMTIESSYNQAGGTFYVGGNSLSVGTAVVPSASFTQTGGIFTASSNNVDLFGPFSRTGGTFNHNNGKIFFFNPLSEDCSIDPNGLEFNDIYFIVNAYSGAGSFTIQSNFSANDINLSNIEHGEQILQGSGSPTITVNNNLFLTYEDWSTFRIGDSTNNISINLAGNFSVTGPAGAFDKFYANLNLINSNKVSTLNSSTIFRNSFASTAAGKTIKFAAGTTQTILGTLTLGGNSGGLITLRSTADDSRWNIDPQGTRSVTYADVKDSNNANEITVLATNSVDNGNNNNWSIQTAEVNPPAVSTGSSSDISSSGAIASATIDNVFGENATVRGFEYGLSETNTWSSRESGSFNISNYNATLQNLNANTTYYYRAFATNSAGTGYGVWQSFTTQAVLITPTVQTQPSVTTNLSNNSTSGSANPSPLNNSVSSQTSKVQDLGNGQVKVGDQIIQTNNDPGDLSTPFKIKATAYSGGQINPSGELTIGRGGAQTFIFVPDDGYAVSMVKVNGVSIKKDSFYTFTNINADQTLEVFFIKENSATAAMMNFYDSLPIPAAVNRIVRSISSSIPEPVKQSLGISAEAIKNALQWVGVPKEAATETISTVVVATYAAFAPLAPITNAISLFSIPEFIHSFWYSMIALATFRRRRRRWGRVLEAGTDLPLSYVRVSLLLVAESGLNKTVATTYTDKEGNYAFAAHPGRYKLEVNKDLYDVVSQVGGYNTNSIIEVKSEENSLVVPVVYMQLNSKHIEAKLSSLRRVNALEKILSYLSFLVLTIGSVISLDSFINSHDNKSLIFFMVYLAFWAINMRVMLKRSPWGRVIDQDKKPIPLAIVRIMDDKMKRLVKTAATNDVGKFAIFIAKGTYKVVAIKNGYKQEKPLDFDAKNKVSMFNQKIEIKSEQ